MLPDFKLPELGENIDSADVVSVLVKEGDVVKAQQDVIEIETDKAVMAVPSDAAGKVTKIHVARGQSVKPGQVILSIDAAAAGSAAAAKSAGGCQSLGGSGEAAAPSPKLLHQQPAAKPAPAPAKPAPQAGDCTSEGSDRGDEADRAGEPGTVRTVAMGMLRREPSRLHRRLPVEEAAEEDTRRSRRCTAIAIGSGRSGSPPIGPRAWASIWRGSDGTGPDGRIVREDVINAVRQANVVAGGSPAAKPARRPARARQLRRRRREAMSKIRKTIAANMVRSATTIPHLTNFDDADITELERLRKESTAAYATSGIKLTSLAFVLKAIALALKQHPIVNASVDMESGEIIYKQYVNLGVAVDTDRGLIVPVLRGVDGLSIPQIAQGIQSLAEKVRNGQQTLDDLRGGTFTISNLGAVGGQYSTPIINHPEVAILLLGRSRKLPVVTADDKIEPRLMMPLSLSYDHRIVDGAAASRFLNEVIGYLESPGRLLLAP